MEKINKKLPDSPGVYFFKRGKAILYIGKATSLRDRVRSYFNSEIITSRGEGILNMVRVATNISFKETESVLEALILESSLIKKHQPKYNTREKDDKSYFYVVFTDEEYPKVLTIRGKDLSSGGPSFVKVGQKFGPFPHGSELKDALKIIRKIFPFADKCNPLQGKECFESQIGLCPGVCTGKISREDYLRNIKNIKFLFLGKKKDILKGLEKKMNEFAKGLQFEKANEIKRQIFGLKHIEDIALIKNREQRNNTERPFRFESYDISHLSNKNRVGVMTVVENGDVVKDQYRKFKIKKLEGKMGDTNDLKEILDRRFYHEEWSLPDIIVVDGGIAQKNVAESMLRALGLKIPVIAITKNEHHKPAKILGDKEIIKKYESDILLSNSEAHRFAVSFQKSLRKL